MRVAVLADIHGNVLALEAVRADLALRHIDHVVNLGDCVSGPLWPRETIDTLQALGWPTVRGNHDRWVAEVPLDRMGPSDRFAHAALAPAQRDWLRALPVARDFGHGLFGFHARPQDDNAYLIEEVENGRLVRAPIAAIAARLNGVSGRVLLCGHSHQPSMLQLPDGGVLVNPGSVGCPAYDDPTPPAHVSEAGSPSARYAVIDLDAERVGVELIVIPYDHVAASRRAAANGRPEWARGLLTGFVRA